MSTEEESKKPESEMGLDLDLHFLPAWAQKSANVNQYEQYSGGGGEGRERRGRREFGDRPPRRDGPRFGGQGGPRGRGPGGPGGPGGGGGQRPQGDRREGGRGDRRGPGGPRGDRRGPGGPPQPERPQIKLPELEVTFIPEEKGVESLARQIKLSGRAYPLFEIAYLVLKKPERYHVHLTSKKKEDGTPVQPIYVCGLDETVWLDETEAMHHVLDKHFGTFYSTERIPTDPPKGVYTFVAQCGMSGTILGPPNYHDYQNKLRKLHQERFSRMPFEAFKSRIKIVKDEAIVKKWLEEQSFRTEYTCLNIPETIKLNTRDEVERHFRETHLPNVIKPVDNYTLPGTAAVNLQNRALQSLLRRNYDEQMRFPLKIVNILSGQFARQGLQFFKVNKSVTHVAVARPRYLDQEASPVSEGIRKIVEFINANPRSTRKKLIEALAPGANVSAAAAAAPAQPVAPATEGAAPTEGGAEAPPAEASAPAAPAAPEVPPQVAAIVSDLHWLVHQGHVIEFANGILETAKKPAPRPPRPEKQQKAEAASEETADVTTQGGVVEGQGTAAEASVAEQTEPASGESTESSAVVQDESGSSAGADVPSGQEMPLSSGEAATEPPSGEENKLETQ